MDKTLTFLSLSQHNQIIEGKCDEKSHRRTVLVFFWNKLTNNRNSVLTLLLLRHAMWDVPRSAVRFPVGSFPGGPAVPAGLSPSGTVLSFSGGGERQRSV